MANIIGYNVYVDGVKYNDNPLRTFRHLITGLTNGVEYEFTVRAVDEFGNESGDSVSVFETPDGFVTDISNRTNERGNDIQFGYLPASICYSRDGFKFYAIENGIPARLHVFSLDFPYILPDVLLVPDQSIDLDNTAGIFDMKFVNADQTVFFINDSELLEYSLSTPGDIATAVLEQSNTEITGRGIEFSLYGHMMYTIQSSGLLSQYTLSAPFYIDQSLFNKGNINLGGGTQTDINNLLFRDNGSKLFTSFRGYGVGTQGAYIKECILPTPFQIEGMSVKTNYRVTPGDGATARAFAIDAEGDRLLLASNFHNNVREFILN